MSAETLPQLHTFEEFCEVVGDGQKADLIDGRIYRDGSDTPRNNLIQNALMLWMSGFASRHHLGDAFTSKVAFVIGRENAVEPDLGFVKAENSAKLQVTHVAGAPDLVVEIVADESRERDYLLKPALYEKAGVGEYWIVDPDQNSIRLLRLEAGRYCEVSPVGAFFAPKSFRGSGLEPTGCSIRMWIAGRACSRSSQAHR